MTAAELAPTDEQRIGRLTVRRRAVAAGAGYREREPAPILELASEPASWVMRRSPRARAIVFSLFTFKISALIVLAAVTRSIPAVGAAAVAIVAVLALVLFSRPPRGAISVRVHDGELSVATARGTRRYAIGRVEEVALGEDGSLSTLWMRVTGEGRVLLMDRLDAKEAHAAVETLTAALDRSRAA